MVEAHGFRSLVTALRSGARESDLSALIASTELSRSFPALGIPVDRGIAALIGAASGTSPDLSDALERELVPYLRRMLEGAEEIEQFVRAFSEEESEVIADAWGRTARLLPPMPRPEKLRLVMIPLGLDFRTDRETVYMDPLAAVSLGLAGVRTTLSHEFHHVGRYLLTGENLNLMVPEAPDRFRHAPDLFRDWASWLELEGIADCVSNVTDTDVPALHPIVASRRSEMDHYQVLLRDGLDGLERWWNFSDPSTGSIAIAHREMRRTAHPVGWGMANSILRQFGAASLVECVGHPERFLRRYNDSAARHDGVTISDRLLAAV